MWIVYLNGGTEHPDVFERADEIVKLIRRNQVIIVTSVITRAELLERRLGPQKLRVYDEQFARKNVVEQPVTRSVCLRASDYRSHFPTLRKGAKFADAVHLATAVDNNVDELHTTDAEDLLPCNGDSMLRGTQVIRPVSDKPNLLTKATPLPVTPVGGSKDETPIPPVTEAAAVTPGAGSTPTPEASEPPPANPTVNEEREPTPPITPETEKTDDKKA
jgi:predicted nucleic acid-binding protein